MSLQWQVYGLPAVLARLKAIPDEVQRRVAVAMYRIVIEAQRRVKQKLSGPVLRNRTGHLRASVTGDVDVTDDAVTGWFGVPAGPTAVYGRVHEFGWKGTQHVSPHDRRMSVVFGHRLREPVVAHVGAYSRQVDFPERSYLRTTLSDMRAVIATRLGEAVRESVQS